MTDFYYIKNVASLSLCRDKCIGCGNCINACPRSVFLLNNKKSEIKDLNACIECGACSKNCPSEAIHVKSGVACATYFLQKKTNSDSADCDCC